jgi:hypothetical protein
LSEISTAWNLRLRKQEHERKPYTLMVSDIDTKQSINEETQVCSFCGKTKPKIETSSLRNLTVMPRNLNKVVLS